MYSEQKIFEKIEPNGKKMSDYIVEALKWNLCEKNQKCKPNRQKMYLYMVGINFSVKSLLQSGANEEKMYAYIV